MSCVTTLPINFKVCVMEWLQWITITNLQYEPLVVLANSKPEDHPSCRSCWCAQLTSPSCSRQSCKTFLDIRGSSSTGLFWMPCPGCASYSSTLSIQSTKSRFEFEFLLHRDNNKNCYFSLSNEFPSSSAKSFGYFYFNFLSLCQH